MVCAVYGNFMDRLFAAISEGLAVFRLVVVVEHGEVALIARGCDEMVIECLADSAAGFVGVCAVGKTAVGGMVENIGEIAGDFLWFHVEGAETFDARRVDEPAPLPVLSKGSFYHLAMRRGVGACVVGFADCCRAQFQARHESVEKR